MMVPEKARDRQRHAEDQNQALDVFRALAAVLVVANHIRAIFFVDLEDSHARNVAGYAFYAATNFAHSAVMLFFVLSGYWVGGKAYEQHKQGLFNLRDYLVARSARLGVVLLPALLLTLAIGCLCIAAFPSADAVTGDVRYHSVVPSDLRERLDPIVFLGNASYLQTTLVPTFGNNGALWSLANEFWYYVWAGLILFLVRARWRRGLAVVAGITLVATAALLWELIPLGAVWLAGALTATRPRRPVRRLGTHRAAGLALLLMSFVVALRIPAIASTALVTVASCYLVYAWTAISADEALPRRRVRAGVLMVARFGQRSSFSLYATHLPIVVLAAAAIGPPAADRWQLTLTTFMAASAIAAASILVAIIFSRFTEARTKSVRRILDGWVPR